MLRYEGGAMMSRREQRCEYMGWPLDAQNDARAAEQEARRILERTEPSRPYHPARYKQTRITLRAAARMASVETAVLALAESLTLAIEELDRLAQSGGAK